MHSVFVVQWCLWISRTAVLAHHQRTILRRAPSAAWAPRLLLLTCPVRTPPLPPPPPPHILCSLPPARTLPLPLPPRPRCPSLSVLTCSSCRARGLWRVLCRCLRCWALVVSAAEPRHPNVNRKEVRDKRPWTMRTVWSNKVTGQLAIFYSYLVSVKEIFRVPYKLRSIEFVS